MHTTNGFTGLDKTHGKVENNRVNPKNPVNRGLDRLGRSDRCARHPKGYSKKTRKFILLIPNTSVS